MALTDFPRRWRFETGIAAVILPPLVHVMPLNRLVPWLSRARPEPTPFPFDPAKAARWVDAVLRRLPWPWRGTCLKRSVVLYWLFHRVGIPVELQVGVKRTPTGTLEAHAWLVRDNRPYLEPGAGNGRGEAAADFTVIARFPEPTAKPS